MENTYQRMLDGKPLELAYGTFEAARVLFMEDKKQWYRQYDSAPIKLRYQLLMETLEHPLLFAAPDEEEEEGLSEQQELQELYFEYIQLLLESKKMDELRLLLEKFRSTQPELYRKDYNFYDLYLVQIALFHGEMEKVADYLDIFIENPVSGIDELIVVLKLLQYYGLTAQAELLSRKVYKTIMDSKKIIPGGEADFVDTIFFAITEKVYCRLQQGDRTSLEEINAELNEFDVYMVQDNYEGMMFQLAPGDDRQKVDNLVWAKTGSADSILKLLGWQFCRYLLERKGLSFVIGGTLFHNLTKTLNIERQRDSVNNGYFEDNGDTLENRPAEQGLPVDCFIFQPNKFNTQLRRLGGFLSSQWPQVAGLLWCAPYFYEFLYEYGGITEDELRHSRDGLNELQQQSIKSNENNLWKYGFVHSWPPPDSVSAEAWAADKERFDRSFSEVPEWAEKRWAAGAPQAGVTKQSTSSRLTLSGVQIPKEQDRKKADKKKLKNKRKEVKKQRRKQRNR
jgi:hypothetical protein